MAPIELVAGLGGAIGSSYRSTRNQLIVAECSGALACIDLIPTATIAAAGVITLRGAHFFDLDTGLHSTTANPDTARDDIWWEQQTDVERTLRPVNGARMVNLGAVNFGSVSHAELMELTYTSAGINGSADATNLLVNGDLFAVRTAAGNYAKLQVLSYGYDIQLRYVTYRLNPRYHVLGTGYDQPTDVAVSADERHAFVAERGGNLLRVDLASADRGCATVISDGLTAPQQMVLDEGHSQLFVVEHALPGRLLRVDLATGAQTTLVAELEYAAGLVLSGDGRFAFVSEQTAAPSGGRVSRIELSTGHRDAIAVGLSAPQFMRWTDAGESGIFVAERAPANRVTRINLTHAPIDTTVVAHALPSPPASLTLTAPNRMLVCGAATISAIDLTDAVYTPDGPLLLGVGHVPVDRISRHSPADPNVDGYADTTVDPGYFFQVKDAPFGGTLPIMLNHARAYAAGARYYKLVVDGVEMRQTWSDRRWSTAASSFESQPITPSASGYYKLRAPSELWYNHWLGYRLDTAALGNGLHVVGVRLYTGQSAITEIGDVGDVGRTMVLQIDNQWPVASIDRILHADTPVGTCGIVDSGRDEFIFDIVAIDPQEHLLSWSLAARWGNNRSTAVDADSYDRHVSPIKKWAGVVGSVPSTAATPWRAAVPGDPFSHWCAHTFSLGVWDRVIDGYSYIHYAAYDKALTIMLPPAP